MPIIKQDVQIHQLVDEHDKTLAVWLALTLDKSGFIAQIYAKDPRAVFGQTPLGSAELDFFGNQINMLAWDPKTESEVIDEFTLVNRVLKDPDDPDDDDE